MDIRIDALPVFQVNSHLEERFPSVCGGILLSPSREYCEEQQAVVITESFALPLSAVENGVLNLKSKDAQNHTKFMISKLGEVGSDNTIAGWYISSSVSGIYDVQVLENMTYLQKQNENSFVLVHDVALSRATEKLHLKAFRITNEFLKQTDTVTKFADVLQKVKDVKSVVEEVKLDVQVTDLVKHLFTKEFGKSADSNLRVPNQSLIERHAEAIIMNSEDIFHDQGVYQRLLTREKQKIAQWQATREAENATRKAKGQALLPTDEWKKLFPTPEDPSKLDTSLLSAQLDERIDQLNDLVEGTSTALNVINKY